MSGSAHGPGRAQGRGGAPRNQAGRKGSQSQERRGGGAGSHVGLYFRVSPAQVTQPLWASFLSPVNGANDVPPRRVV